MQLRLASAPEAGDAGRCGMNLIRTIMSIFLLLLLAVSVAGRLWAEQGMKPELLAGGRRVLAACGLSALLALWLIWRFRQPDVV